MVSCGLCAESYNKKYLTDDVCDSCLGEDFPSVLKNGIKRVVVDHHVRLFIIFLVLGVGAYAGFKVVNLGEAIGLYALIHTLIMLFVVLFVLVFGCFVRFRVFHRKLNVAPAIVICLLFFAVCASLVVVDIGSFVFILLVDLLFRILRKENLSVLVKFEGSKKKFIEAYDALDKSSELKEKYSRLRRSLDEDVPDDFKDALSRRVENKRKEIMGLC